MVPAQRQHGKRRCERKQINPSTGFKRIRRRDRSALGFKLRFLLGSGFSLMFRLRRKHGRVRKLRRRRHTRQLDFGGRRNNGCGRNLGTSTDPPTNESDEERDQRDQSPLSHRNLPADRPTLRAEVTARCRRGFDTSVRTELTSQGTVFTLPPLGARGTHVASRVVHARELVDNKESCGTSRGAPWNPHHRLRGRAPKSAAFRDIAEPGT